jgi:hypothetical protein
MLYLIRRAVSPNKILLALGGFIGVMTVVFGIISPAFNIFSLQVGFGSLLFTAVAGILLAAALVALGAYGSLRAANFAVAFLAVQSLLNSLVDLKTLFFINAPLYGSDIATDAGNMANATGLPGIVWVFIWIGISIAMISVGLRLYAVNQNRTSPKDTVFED